MPTSDTKQRTISYRRVNFAELDATMTLQQALDACLNILPKSDDTRLGLGEGSAEIRHRDSNSQRLCIHVAAWTDGEEVSTVPHVTSGIEADLAVQPPGEQWDYLDGDGMMLVSENHCLLLPSGLHPKSVERYIRKLLVHGREKGAKIPEDMEKFQLVEIINDKVAQQIQKEGVKKIDLNVGQYMETARRRMEDRQETIIEKIGRSILETLVTKDEDRRRLQEAENVQAKLVISLDGRRSGMTAEELAPIVEDIEAELENKDDIDIVTGSGQRIKRGHLVLTKQINIGTFGKTVHHQDTWDEMEEYLIELKRKGALDE